MGPRPLREGNFSEISPFPSAPTSARLRSVTRAVSVFSTVPVIRMSGVERKRLGVQGDHLGVRVLPCVSSDSYTLNLPKEEKFVSKVTKNISSKFIRR